MATSKDNRFMGDDEEARALVIIPGGGDALDKPEDPEQEMSDEKAEDDFLKWSDDMDAADAEKSQREDALGAIASHGIDLTQPLTRDSDEPAHERSTAYLHAYVQAKYDSGEWKARRADEIKEENGKFCVYSKNGEKKLGEYDTREEADARLAQVERFTADAGDQERDEIGRFGSGGGGGGKKEKAPKEHNPRKAAAAVRGADNANENVHEAKSMGDADMASSQANEASRFADKASAHGSGTQHERDAHSFAATAHQTAAATVAQDKARAGTDVVHEVENHDQLIAHHEKMAAEHSAKSGAAKGGGEKASKVSAPKPEISAEEAHAVHEKEFQDNIAAMKEAHGDRLQPAYIKQQEEERDRKIQLTQAYAKNPEPPPEFQGKHAVAKAAIWAGDRGLTKLSDKLLTEHQSAMRKEKGPIPAKAERDLIARVMGTVKSKKGDSFYEEGESDGDDDLQYPEDDPEDQGPEEFERWSDAIDEKNQRQDAGDWERDEAGKFSGSGGGGGSSPAKAARDHAVAAGAHAAKLKKENHPHAEHAAKAAKSARSAARASEAAHASGDKAAAEKHAVRAKEHFKTASAHVEKEKPASPKAHNPAADAMSKAADNETKLSEKYKTANSHHNAISAHSVAAQMHAESGNHEKAAEHTKKVAEHKASLAPKAAGNSPLDKLSAKAEAKSAVATNFAGHMEAAGAHRNAAIEHKQAGNHAKAKEHDAKANAHSAASQTAPGADTKVVASAAPDYKALAKESTDKAAAATNSLILGAGSAEGHKNAADLHKIAAAHHETIGNKKEAKAHDEKAKAHGATAAKMAEKLVPLSREEHKQASAELNAEKHAAIAGKGMTQTQVNKVVEEYGKKQEKLNAGRLLHKFPVGKEVTTAAPGQMFTSTGANQHYGKVIGHHPETGHPQVKFNNGQTRHVNPKAESLDRVHESKK